MGAGSGWWGHISDTTNVPFMVLRSFYGVQYYCPHLPQNGPFMEVYVVSVHVDCRNSELFFYERGAMMAVAVARLIPLYTSHSLETFQDDEGVNISL